MIADSPFSNEELRKTIANDKRHLSEEYAYANLHFHDSDSWLLPVARNILTTWSPLKGGYPPQYVRLQHLTIRTETAEIFRSVVEFIKWYNEHEK